MKQRHDDHNDHERRLIRLETVIESINTTLARLDARMDRLDTRMDRLDARVDYLSDRIDRMGAELNGKIESHFKWLLTIGLGATGTLLAVIAHGFKWI